jgi:hypothetical protein
MLYHVGVSRIVISYKIMLFIYAFTIDFMVYLSVCQNEGQMGGTVLLE